MNDIKTALALVETGQVEEAHELLKSALDKANDDEKYMIAELFEEWGFFEDAVAVMEGLLKTHPDEGQLIIKLAEIYVELKEDEKAIQLLDRMDKNHPFYIHALLLLADMYEREGLFEVAEQKLLEARELVSEEEGYVIDFALGELLYSIGEVNRAITFYEKTLKKHEEINGVSLVERLAESHAYVGQYEIALQYYDKLTDRDPNRLFKHAYTAYQAKQLNRAIQLWEETIEQDPYYHSAYYELASTYEEVGKQKEALNIVKKGLTYDEFDKRLYYLAGKLSWQLDETNEAINYLKHSIELDEDYKKAILLLVTVYKKLGDNEAILALLEKTKQWGGADPLYDWELAKAYNDLEKYDSAKRAYEDAFYQLADDKEFLKEYGYFLIEDGSIDKGTELLTKYVELEPNDIDTIAYLERIHFSNDSEI